MDAWKRVIWLNLEDGKALGTKECLCQPFHREFPASWLSSELTVMHK